MTGRRDRKRTPTRPPARPPMRGMGKRIHGFSNKPNRTEPNRLEPNQPTEPNRTEPIPPAGAADDRDAAPPGDPGHRDSESDSDSAFAGFTPLPLIVLSLKPASSSCSVSGRTSRNPTNVASVCHQMLCGRCGS